MNDDFQIAVASIMYSEIFDDLGSAILEDGIENHTTSSGTTAQPASSGVAPGVMPFEGMHYRRLFRSVVRTNERSDPLADRANRLRSGNELRPKRS